MAYDTEITRLSQISKEKTAEFLAFVDCLDGLTCRQQEALGQIIQQILGLEAQGDYIAIAQLLTDAPALLKLTSGSN